MSDADKMKYEMTIKILTYEIKERKGTVISRAFCRKRAMFCYRNAYIKANFPDKFNCFIKNENKED